jgi:sterol 3beta-glucosyltransferase
MVSHANGETPPVVTILCSGTRGDVQPYVALAQELRKLGMNARIAANRDFEGFVRGYGVDYLPVDVDLESVGVDPEMIREARRADNVFRMLVTFRRMREYGAHMVEGYHDACLGSDAIVYHPGLTIGYFMAERAGIPSVLASPFPIHRTSRRPSIIGYGRTRSSGLGNRLSHTALQQMLWMTSTASLRPFWVSRYGALPRGFGVPFERHADERHPAVISCSDHVFPRPSDWNRHVHQHGYWFVQEPQQYEPPAALRRYLETGAPPVYVGFGSMVDPHDAGRIAREVADALRRAGRRGVVSGMGRVDGLPDNVIAIDGAPHSWLFPRMAAVVHHGGAGTSAAGFRAGVPSIIVPFALDQHGWAHRAHQLGVGPEPVPAKLLTAERLADAIRVGTSPEIVAKARRLGEAIASERGARDAAMVIEAAVRAPAGL